jgi:hypothetical protein
VQADDEVDRFDVAHVERAAQDWWDFEAVDLAGSRDQSLALSSES